MADNVHQAFDNLSLNRPQQLSVHSNSNGTLSSQASSSLRSPSGSYMGGPQSQGPAAGATHGSVGEGQSAAARFEQFFKASSPTPQSLDVSSGLGHGGFGQHSPVTLGHGSSAAGLASSGAFGSFGHNINVGGGSVGQSGGAGNANMFGNNATLPALRSKPSGIRQGLPAQWGVGGGNVDDLGALGVGTSQSPPQHFNNAASGSIFSGPNAFNANAIGSAGSPIQDDDIIPTAIVVKNIPFSIKREQLLQIIEDLQIPMPYAFNYHFDQGVFRGLAFANFRSGEEADAVVAALNGFDVSGRKLRVEYKKVLQAGEKERIEKEKAIKRMQSMQMEKERMRRQTVTTGVGEDWKAQFGGSAPPVPNLPGTSPGGPNNLDADPAYFDTLGEQQQYQPEQPQNLSVPELVQPPASTSESQSDLAAGAASDLGGRKDELDLNDPATLEIYSRVLLFKDDRMRDELSFSKNLTTNERRIVHMVSKKLGLYHYSLGEGEERYVIVTKNEVNQQHRPLRSQASTIGRSNRGVDGLGASSGGNGLLSPGSSYTMGRNALRTKKSAPDMKRQRERSDDGAFGGASTYGFNAGASNGLHGSYLAGLARKSNGNLREGYSSTGRRSQPGSGNTVGGAAGLQSLFSSPFDIPPVPALPVHSPDGGLSHSPSPSPIGTHSNNGSLSAASSQHILRQPTGPGAANRNFAQRSRVPLGNIGSGAGSFADGIFGAGSPSANGQSSALDRANSGGGPGELQQDDVQSHQPLEV